MSALLLFPHRDGGSFVKSVGVKLGGWGVQCSLLECAGAVRDWSNYLESNKYYVRG